MRIHTLLAYYVWLGGRHKGFAHIMITSDPRRSQEIRNRMIERGVYWWKIMLIPDKEFVFKERRLAVDGTPQFVKGPMRYFTLFLAIHFPQEYICNQRTRSL